MTKRFAYALATVIALQQPAASAQSQAPYFRFTSPKPAPSASDPGTPTESTPRGPPPTSTNGAPPPSGSVGESPSPTPSFSLAGPGDQRLRVGYPYRVAIQASNAQGSVSWSSIGDALPGGIILGQDGVLSGTPGTAGRADAVQIFAQDSQGRTSKTTSFAMDVRPPPSASYAPAAHTYAGDTVNLAPTVSEAYGRQTWRLVSGTLPSGLSLDTSTGAIKGVPDTQGSQGAIATAVIDGDGAEGVSNAFALTIEPKPTLSYDSATLDIGPTYSFAPAVTGLSAPYSFRLASRSGAPNCTGPDASGTLTCQQTAGDSAAGTYDVTASDPADRSADSGAFSYVNGGTQGFSVGDGRTVLRARTGSAFNGAVTVTKPPGTVAFAALDQLPAGFSLDGATGAIAAANVPASAIGTASSRIQGTAVSGRVTQRAVAPYRFAIAAPPAVAAPSAVQASQGTPYSASGSISNIFDGAIPAVTASGLPAGLSIAPSAGAYSITGTPTQAGSFPVTVSATDPADRATGSASVTLVVTAATVTPSTSGIPLVEGDPASFSFTTNLPNPTWTYAGNPSWLALAPSDGTLTASGTSPDVGQPATYTVTATATANGVAASASTTVQVSPATASFVDPGPVRSGAPASVSISTTMAAAGGWAVSGWGGPGGLAVADPAAHATTATGTYPVNSSSGPVSATFNATYTASAPPSTGTPASAAVSPSVTVYPPLVAGTAPDAAYTAGSAFSAAPPAVTGGYGTISWKVLSGGQDVSANLGGVIPGLTFDPVSGRISGTPSRGGTARLAYRAHDDGKNVPAMAMDADSNAFTVSGADAAASASNPAPSLQPGDALSTTVTTSIDAPTWTVSDAPSWISQAQAGKSLTLSGTAPALAQAGDYTVTVTATNPGASTSTPVRIHVAPVSASLAAVTTRSGRAFAAALTTNYPNGNWAMQPTSPPDVTFSGYASQSFPGTAPGNAGTAALSRTMVAAPQGTTGITASSTLTVYPDVSLGAQTNWSRPVGVALTIPAPQAYGTIGSVSWRLLNGAADVTSSLGSTCPGFAFSPTSGTISGTGTSPCNASLSYVATDAAEGTGLREDGTSQPFTLRITPSTGSGAPMGPTATPSTSAVSIVEGSPASFSVSTSLSNPTWSVSGNPAWMTFATDTGTYATSSVSPHSDPAQSFTVTVTATDANGSTASASVPVSVATGTGSVGSIAVRSGTAFSVPLTTNIVAAGTWTASAPADVTGVSTSGGRFSGTAPTNNGTTAVTRTLGATYAASAAPAAGTTAYAVASPGTLTVQPPLTIQSQSARTASVGSATSFGPPAVSGVVGKAGYSLLQGTTDVSDTLGQTCAGLQFSRSTGTVQGTPTSACSPSLTYGVSDDGNGDLNLATTAASPMPFALTVSNATITASPASPSVTEGDTVTFSATTSLPNPTWTISGNPDWMTFSASGASFSTNSVSADVTAATGSSQTFNVTLTATSGSYVAQQVVPVTVANSTLSMGPADSAVRAGQPFGMGGIAMSMKAPGSYAFASSPSGAAFSGVANGRLTGTAPAAPASNPATYSILGTYTATAGPSSGTAAYSQASSPLTVYQPLAFASAPPARSGSVGTQIPTFSPPAVNGKAGALTYQLTSNGQDVSGNLSGLCKGMSFDPATGQIYGTPASACSATLAYGVTDDGSGVAALQATAASASFTLTVSSSGPDQFSFAPVSNATGGTAYDGVATLTGMTGPGQFSVTTNDGSSVAIGINGATPSTTIPSSVPANPTIDVRITSVAGTNGGTRSATVTVAGIKATYTVTTADTTPDQFYITGATNQPYNSTATSSQVSVSGITAPTQVSVSGDPSAQVSVNGGAFSNAPQTVYNGSTFTVRLATAGTPKTTLTATVNVGGVTGTYSTVTGTDVPDAMTCVDKNATVYPATGGQEYQCQIYLTGMTLPGRWTVSGQYSRVYTQDAGWTTNASGTVAANGYMILAVTAPAGTNGGTNAATLSVATTPLTMSVRTGDTTPDAFAFTDVTNQPLSAQVASNRVTITGIDQPAAVTFPNNSSSSAAPGTASVNGGGYTGAPSQVTVSNNQTLSVAFKSASTYDTTSKLLVNVGGVTTTWSVTTQSYPCDGTGNSTTNQNEYFYYSPDVQSAGWVAIRHWIRFGYFEARKSCYVVPACNAYQDGGNNAQNGYVYKYFNPDVANAGIDPYTHWINYGQSEGRVGCYPRSDNR